MSASRPSLLVIALLGFAATALVPAPSSAQGDPASPGWNPARTNPCAARSLNPCAGGSNPCAKRSNPCNPCANPCAKGSNPCNPCAKGSNPCNPCANPCARGSNPCNPCAGGSNPCNPCAKRFNPCNPCGAANPCNPCAKRFNPCNPCGAANPCNPCGSANPCNPYAGAAPPAVYEGDAGLERLLEVRRALDDAKRAARGEKVRDTMKRVDREGDAMEEAVLGEPQPGPGPHPHDAWARLLRVTHDNPLVTEECRLDALSEVGSHFGRTTGLDPAAHYVDHQRAHVANLTGTSDDLTEEILAHVENCPHFCLPFLGHLVQCHVEAVAQKRRLIVFFPVDADQVPRTYEPSLASFARRTLREGQSVILFGSASNLGGTSPAYDENLSLRRAVSVKDSLVDAGLPLDRIRVKWLAWQEPRLSGRRLAERWGVASELRRMENVEFMNQNVVVVAY